MLGQVEDKLFGENGHGPWFDNDDTTTMPREPHSNVETFWNLFNLDRVRQHGTLSEKDRDGSGVTFGQP